MGGRGVERESVERFAGEGEEKRGSERRPAAKHSRSVDGKKDNYLVPVFNLTAALNTPTLRALLGTRCGDDFVLIALGLCDRY